MASSKRTGEVGWSALVAEPDGRGGAHARLLRRVSEDATKPIAGSPEVLLAGADQALAARAVLRGADASRDFLAAVGPMVKSLARRMAMFPESVADQVAVNLLALAGIGETAGAALPLGKADLGSRFERFMVNKTFSKQDDVTVAWLALGLGRVDDVALLFGKEPPPKGPSGDPIALVKTAAAALKSKGARAAVEPFWSAYLRGFPAMLRDEQAEWRHLVLAARVVLGTIEGVPMGEVADTLHRHVVALARESA